MTSQTSRTVVATATANNAFQGKFVGNLFYLAPSDTNDLDSWDITLAADVTFEFAAKGAQFWPPNQRTDVYVLLRQDTIGSHTASWPAAVTFAGTAPQPTADTPVLLHLITLDGVTWFATEEPPPSGSSGQSLGLWLYGDGSDGPLKFTATPRTVTDAVTRPGSPIITSATAAFTNADVGLVVDDGALTTTAGHSSIPGGTRIESVTNGTTAVMTTNASTAAASADTVLIGAPVISVGSYSSIDIATGASVRPIPYGSKYGSVLVNGTYTIAGEVDLSGTGAAITAGTIGGGVTGKSPWSGPLGGNGGTGSTLTSADTLGGPSFANNNTGSSGQTQRQPFFSFDFNALASGPSTGGGGGGDGVNEGGDGGNGGNWFAICAKNIVHLAGATYNVKGQDGGAGEPGAGSNVAASVLADGAPTLPLTIVAATNDTFTFTGATVNGGGTDTPEVFTIAPGTYTTIAQVVAAVGAAVGSVSSEAFSTLVTPSNSAGSVLLTMVANSHGFGIANGNTITEGNGGAAAVGFTANPDTFAGGASVGNTGGGGGGQDGGWFTYSDTLTGAPTITGGGGAGGAGHGTGTDGTAGQPGFGVHYTPSGVTIQNA